MMPKAVITSTSPTLELSVYVPMQHRIRMLEQIAVGHLQQPHPDSDQRQLRITSMRLPIHMLAIRPQNSAGCLVIISGPG